jgi:hypothetical protein
VSKHRVGSECFFDVLDGEGNSVGVSIAPLDFEETIQRGNQLGKLRNPSPIELAKSDELASVSGVLDLGVEDLVHVVDIGFDSFARNLEAQVVEYAETEGTLGDGECHTIVLDTIHH